MQSGAMVRAGCCICGLLQINVGLPQRGIYHAAETAQHLIVRADIKEAPEDVV
jgi:hypothetical protein